MGFLYCDPALRLDFLWGARHISAISSARSLLGFRCGRHSKEQPMLDVILLAVGLAFFALSIAYAFGCDLL
jgi:hypothetical protein